MAGEYIASDEFIVWANSLSGMLTSIKSKYGSVSEMVESSDWDEGRTDHAVRLLTALHKSVREMDTELKRHVNEKYG